MSAGHRLVGGARDEPWRERLIEAITIYDGTGPTDFVRRQDGGGQTFWQEAAPGVQGRPTRARKNAPQISAKDFLEALRGPFGA